MSSKDGKEDLGARQRKLTEKGQQLFEEKVQVLMNKYNLLKTEISRLQATFDHECTDSDKIQTFEKYISELQEKLMSASNELIVFLSASRTEQASTILEHHVLENSTFQNECSKFLQNILSAALHTPDNAPSLKSKRSVTSKKQKEANVQEEKLKYMKQIAHVEKRKLDLQLKLLQQEEKVAVAQAEANSCNESELDVKPGVPVIEKLSQKDKVEQYLNVHAEAFMPGQAQTQEVIEECNVLNDISNFLLKKNLIVDKIEQFNDKPENYLAWKCSFQRIVNELKVTPAEELDLLAKYLGKESKEYAQSIRSANVINPERGLELIWIRLENLYGRPEMIERSLKTRLNSMPKLVDQNPKQYYRLLDVLLEIQSYKENPTYTCILSYFDSSSGVQPIVAKLPRGLQDRWATKATRYKHSHYVAFPPFTYFVSYIQELCDIKNDPGLNVNEPRQQKDKNEDCFVRTANVVDSSKRPNYVRCPIHKSDHSLDTCRLFLNMSREQKIDTIGKSGFCFRCCKHKHQARNCNVRITCDNCGSNQHASCMHIFEGSRSNKVSNQGEKKEKAHGGEQQTVSSVSAKCTEICGDNFSGRSCGKIVLVKVYPNGEPELAKTMYALVDDQSNKTLGRSKLFDLFNIEQESGVFNLSTCNGTVTYTGRSAENLCIESIDGNTAFSLPKVIECDEIPINTSEIPTKDVARAFTHLQEIEPMIPELDPSADILILIGRDLPQAHHVLDQRLGISNQPFAQKLHLGWTIIGEVCLGSVHRPKDVYVRKTVLGSGRGTVYEPCQATFHAKDIQYDIAERDACVFSTSCADEKPGQSVEDREFLELMDQTFHMDDEGKWTCPLPFRPNRQRLPNNADQAKKRAILLDKSFQRNPTKQQHAVEFMGNIIDRGHAELAPPLRPTEECWYLPIFGVYHPQKPNKIRMVFDSSAKYQGTSLNDVLLSGPDMMNSLIGVLVRFRQEKVAVSADIEQMFHCFAVQENCRNFLRFFWYKDNVQTNPLVEYRMTVHVFGNSPSPAVATYGIRHAANEAHMQYGTDVCDFVNNNFYVDDGLVSLPSYEDAVDLLTRTQKALKAQGNIRLHKIASNNLQVMQSFAPEDLSKDLTQIDLNSDELPMQRSLGLLWDLQRDSFTFRLNYDKKPFTHRGVLSYVNSLYDPLGFVSPVSIQGKLLIRQMTQTLCTEWDEPLPEQFHDKWTSWIQSLVILEELAIPRMYVPLGLSETKSIRIAVFTDASEQAIAAAAYLYVEDAVDNAYVGFILGKAKVAPKAATSVPRLELCAAVLGIEIAELVKDQLGFDAEQFDFFTDSMIVLGYIYNRTRRFLTYVSNRVQRIHSFATSVKWRHVPSGQNPADSGTKMFKSQIALQRWLLGPVEWLMSQSMTIDTDLTYDLVDPDCDNELKQEVNVKRTDVNQSDAIHFPASLGTDRYKRFSTWTSLIRGVSCLICFIRKFRRSVVDEIEIRQQAQKVIIKSVQQEAFEQDVSRLQNQKPVSSSSRLKKLDPVFDNDGMIRVGGRLSHGEFDLGVKSPLVVPGDCHVAILVVFHHHSSIHHQGRHLTEGAVRSAGLWVLGGKRLVSSVIYKCVKCRKCRGSTLTQKMGDLPRERLLSSPPFTYVGVDCFGPWTISTRRTRGGAAESKRWAVLFTCMCSRAVHIEVLEQMTTSCFINALRRFYAIRGSVKEFFSDRGSNFVGCVNELGIESVCVEMSPVNEFLKDHGTLWKFNPPHASHMGGVWERLIGVTRRIIDNILMDSKHSKLTHEVLCTFFAEASAIINARPLTAVSTDPSDPMVMSPSVLITQKLSDAEEPAMNLDIRDMYTSQWKYVQVLADKFWCQWRQQYLQSLQVRQKWASESPNVKEGDVILLKDETKHRNLWPMGRVSRVFPGKDNLVRTVELTVSIDGAVRTYVRPITQVVLLYSCVTG